MIKIIEPIFEKIFIYDSCANRIGKGNLFAIKRFDQFKRKVSKNNTRSCFVLKADIKHYFQEVDHKILINIIKKKIYDDKIIGLIEKILSNYKLPIANQRLNKGMPLGNLTSQFFANIYLNELDYFVKHILKAKYYIRYVDDFVIMNNSKEQLEIWKVEIDKFLRDKLKIELHSQKSRIISLSRGIDFVGFRNFYNHRPLRKRNIRKMQSRIENYKQGRVSKEKFLKSFQGWNSYAKWANSYKSKRRMLNSLLLNHQIF